MNQNRAAEKQLWLAEKLAILRHSLRTGQQGLANWQGGEMAVSAVPGAGKSHSLSVAAAIAIAQNQLHSRRQLIVVTYTRSAAANIKCKIRDRLKDLMLSPGGFAVHTLHGLALNIANSRKELSGLNLDNVTIVVPNTGHPIIRGAVEKWIADHPVEYQSLLAGVEFDGEETERLRRQSVLRTEVLPGLTYTAVKEAKSSGLTPKQLLELTQAVNQNTIQNTTDEYDILGIAAGLYSEYQKLMRSQDLIDYDDMILGALKVLAYPPMLTLWQNQVYGVFEDEAQDSSPLQEKLISILADNSLSSSSADSSPNLVRVGDPNQAINSTFTPADPIYFNWFCETCQGKNTLSTMNQAGRSSKIIIDSANFVVHWVNQLWSKNQAQENSTENSQGNVGHLQSLPFRPQNIVTVAADDPQPEANPQPEGSGVVICNPDDVYQTVEQIGKQAIALFKDHPQRNGAILVRENRQARFLAEQLAYLEREHQISIFEVGESERYSQIPAEILKLLRFIDRPHSTDNLKAALEVLEQRSLIPTQDFNALAIFPEQFLYPTALHPKQKPQVIQARRYCCNLLRARMELPHYQLIPFLGMTLQYTGSELATVQKLSEKVSQQIKGRSSSRSSSSSKAAIEVIEEIVNAENFEAVAEDDGDRYTRAGQITIITMHKAKGLDWDYVFIPFLHQDILPGQPWIPNAGKFLGSFTLSEVARAQIRALVHHQYLAPDQPQTFPQPTEAWLEAVKLKQAEEYRLLYVAMTRAKRLLWMSAAELGPFRWSVFQSDKPESLQRKKPCPVLPALALHLRDSSLKY